MGQKWPWVRLNGLKGLVARALRHYIKGMPARRFPPPWTFEEATTPASSWGLPRLHLAHDNGGCVQREGIIDAEKASLRPRSLRADRSALP